MTGPSRIRTSPHGALRFQLFLRQIAAAVGVLLLLSSPLSEALHTLLVPHTICAEHGEVIHLDGKPELLAAARGSSKGVAFEASEVGQGAGHEHCPVVLEGSRRLAPQDAASSLLLPARVTTDEPVVEFPLRPHPSVELTLLAPKTSPPIRA